VPVLASDALFGVPSLYFTVGSPLRGLILSWNLFSPEVWVQLPNWQTWHVLLGYVAIASGFLLLRLLMRSGSCSRQLPWLTLGAALSLLPCAGSLPEDRLLVAATLGRSALVASALVYTFPFHALRTGRARLFLSALWLLLLWVPIGDGLRSYDDVRSFRYGSDVMRAWSLDADLPEQAKSSTRVYVLAAGDFTTAVILPWLRLLHGHPLPRSYRRLCPGGLPVNLSRTTDRVLSVDVLTSGVRGTAVPSLYRAADLPMLAGQHVELPGFTVDVVRVSEGNPTRMRFEFDRSLDDPALWILIATEHGLRRRRMPAIGETILVPQAQFRDLRH
jgi:hypothetical protein